ncbi:MAG: MFS transporter [Candidatus Dormibacteraceae bacterium]
MSRAQRWTLAAAVLGTGIVFLDSTVVNVALPRIGRELPSHLFGVLEGQAYVYSAYLLTLSALLILAGALNDHYGRRRMFALGLAGFGATSVLCGLAPSMEALILFRVLQGAAGALLVPGSLSLIAGAFSGESQGRAYGIWSAASSGTTLLGPLVGGLLVDTISWRAAFLINVPLVLVALYAVLTQVEESRNDESEARFDWVGAAVVAVAVGGLAFGPIYGQQREWRDPVAYVAIAIGAAALIALPWLMLRSAHPLIPPGLFRSSNFTVINVSTLVIYGALYVVGYNLTLYLQGTLGYTAAGAGLANIPGSLFMIFLSSRFGRLAGRFGGRWFLTAGPLLMAVGVLWWARLPAFSTPWALTPGAPASYLPSTGYLVDVLPGSLFFGVGLAVLVAPLVAALMSSVPVRNSGVASAINNAISRIGPQLAGAAIFVAITATFYHSLGALVPGLDISSKSVREAISPLNRPLQHVAEARLASADAIHVAMLIGALLLVAGAIVNAVGLRTSGTPAVVAVPGSVVEA